MVVALVTGSASAKPLAPALSVERDAAASDCPNTEALQRQVEGLLRRPQSEPSPSYDLVRIRVRFTRSAEGYGAELGFEGAKQGERTLRDQGPRCGALAEAVSVTIALLLDTELAAEQAPSDEPKTAAAPELSASVASASGPAPSPRAAPREVSMLAALEAGAGWFTSSTPQPLLFGRLGVRFKPWLAEAGFGAALPSTQSYAAGEVETGLVFGSVRGCYTFGSELSFGPCAELGLGALRGSGRGYEEARSVTLSWSAVGVGVLLQGQLGKRGYWGATAVGWLPTHRQTFSVENAGTAWESPAFAGSFALRAGLGIW